MLKSLGTRIVRAALLASALRGIVRFVVGSVGSIDSSPRTSRRDFLRWTVAGTLSFFTLESLAGFVAFFWPLKVGAFGSEITVNREDIPPVGADPLVVREGKFWLINNEDGLLALYWKCVHLGCTVPWRADEGQFHCPCHGSLYDRFGRVTGGPAPRPLDLMAIEVSGDGVVVDTGEITVRQRYDPSQAVKIS